ncbi:hypothetical protein JCM1840_002183 [Sporobolomyces johnsonii]
MRAAVFSLLASALALASGVSAAAGSAGPSRLEGRAPTPAEYTGEKCAVARGKNEKVGLGDCSSAAAEWDVVCRKCGTTECGDPYATECWIRSTTVPGQCAYRQDKKIETAACSDTDKKNIWAFYLS